MFEYLYILCFFPEAENTLVFAWVLSLRSCCEHGHVWWFWIFQRPHGQKEIGHEGRSKWSSDTFRSIDAKSLMGKPAVGWNFWETRGKHGRTWSICFRIFDCSSSCIITWNTIICSADRLWHAVKVRNFVFWHRNSSIVIHFPHQHQWKIRLYTQLPCSRDGTS